jgi:formylmethanofuran dehydrogenase subunit D
MRLQKQRSREVKGKEYFRWTVVISPNDVKKLGWDEGEELSANVRQGRLVLASPKKPEDGGDRSAT